MGLPKRTGKPIHSIRDFAAIFEDGGVGDKVSLTVTRDGKTRTLEVAIADLSQLDQG